MDGPVVAGIDGTPGSRRAVLWAADEAARRHAPLEIVHAYGIPDAFYGEAMPPRDWLDARRAESQDLLLESAAAATTRNPGLRVHPESVLDAPIPLLVRRSGEAGMLVLGSAGRGALGELLSGSVAGALAAHARCPFAVVRGADRGGEAPVVVGVDGSPAGRPALALAFEEAALRGAPLVALHAWSDSDKAQLFSAARAEFDFEPLREAETRVLAESLAGWREAYPDVTVQRVAERDRPRHQLLDWSKRAQLVVVGSRGRGGFRGLLVGSTTYALLHHASCPVLIARSQ
ncbi:MAG TPA: universal stress protein [Amycolatopsis sp.]|nr:universal stress protein [Amycolatopsis sp.]